MRVYCAVNVVLVAVAVGVTAFAPMASSSGVEATPKDDQRFVVVGVDGKVVPGANPGLYLPKKLPAVFIEHWGERHAFPSQSDAGQLAFGGQKDKGAEPPQRQRVNERHEEFLVQVVTPAVEEHDDDEFSGPIDFHLDANPLESASPFFLDSEVPAAQGSIVFAELSCFFVAFIGYLVRSIRLWRSFSRGQKCCLSAVFGSAVLYQAAVVAWYLGFLSSDAILALSSLITRMISLGMVPITTTSFMGRARELCHEQQFESSPRSSASSFSRSSHRHRNNQPSRYS